MQSRFTNYAQTALAQAAKCARSLKQGYIGTEHILVCDKSDRAVRRAGDLNLAVADTDTLAKECDAILIVLPKAAFVEMGEEWKKFSGKLLQTPPGGDADIDFTIPGGSSLSDRIAFLASNNLGGMAQIRARWGEIFSKYDCWLGANCSHEMPRDRRIMLSRIRGWIVCGGYSTELSANVIKSFTAAGGNIAVWDFDVPAGSGRKAGITVTVRFSTGSDAVKAEFKRSKKILMTWKIK